MVPMRSAASGGHIERRGGAAPGSAALNNLRGTAADAEIKLPAAWNGWARMLRIRGIRLGMACDPHPQNTPAELVHRLNACTRFSVPPRNNDSDFTGRIWILPDFFGGMDQTSPVPNVHMNPNEYNVRSRTGQGVLRVLSPPLRRNVEQP